MRHPPTMPISEKLRIHSRRDGDCLVWTRYCHTGGYGYMRIKGRACFVHRLAWELMNGPIPKGLWVLHKCDNPPCFNVNHLFLGSHIDNERDKINKNRQAIGSRHGRSKLTEEDVISIRNNYANNTVSQYLLAKKYGVCQAQISNIIRKKKWSQVIVQRKEDARRGQEP